MRKKMREGLQVLKPGETGNAVVAAKAATY
jgi:hypothetical protein